MSIEDDRDSIRISVIEVNANSNVCDASTNTYNENSNSDSDKRSDSDNEINKKLDKILELLEKDCKKMSDHIDFIETVYDTVKTPFNFIMNTVSNIVPDRYQLN